MEPWIAHVAFRRIGVECPKCQSSNVVLYHPFHMRWIGAACKECGKQFNLPKDNVNADGAEQRSSPSRS
jgi:transposase-like protein